MRCASRYSCLRRRPILIEKRALAVYRNFDPQLEYDATTPTERRCSNRGGESAVSAHAA